MLWLSTPVILEPPWIVESPGHVVLHLGVCGKLRLPRVVLPRDLPGKNFQATSRPLPKRFILPTVGATITTNIVVPSLLLPVTSKSDLGLCYVRGWHGGPCESEFRLLRLSVVSMEVCGMYVPGPEKVIGTLQKRCFQVDEVVFRLRFGQIRSCTGRPGYQRGN